MSTVLLAQSIGEAFQAAHARFAHDESRCARYPATSRVPSGAAGVKNTANIAVPTATAQSNSATTRVAGSPAVVRIPGSGIPKRTRAWAVDNPDSMTARAAPMTSRTRMTGQTGRRTLARGELMGSS